MAPFFSLKFMAKYLKDLREIPIIIFSINLSIRYLVSSDEVCLVLLKSILPLKSLLILAHLDSTSDMREIEAFR